MPLREAINTSTARGFYRGPVMPVLPRRATALAAVKARLHDSLLQRFDVTSIETIAPDQLRSQLKDAIEDLLNEEVLALSAAERSSIVRDIQNEVTGLGPIEPLMADPSVSDILVNGPSHIYIERHGKLELSGVEFHDNAHLLKIIERIVSRVGRRIDESSPMVDARLPDGSRVNAVIPPLAIDGPSLSIRRFAVVPLQMAGLIGHGALSDAMAEVIQGLVRARVNILISGGTGAGKTTLLNVLSASIPDSERIVTIEDAAELRLQQPHVVRLETRAPNLEGNGEVTQRALLRNCLRMRPDRIVVGEVRGGEVLDMLQAMNTGHDGSMTTIHANTPRDALTRLENMACMSGVSIPPKAFREQIVAAISVVIQATRLNDGRRKVTSIQEITGFDGETVAMQEIFRFEQTGIDAQGGVQGGFTATGVQPVFLDRMRMHGVKVSDALFAAGAQVS